MASQTCYRHTGRVTGASCTRCGRPICPDCMIEAPVGHHCPTCVHEARTEMKQVKKVVFTRGGQMAAAGGIVCTLLVAANVVVFVLGLGDRSIDLRFANNAFVIAQNGEYYRMLTSAFLHAGLFHIGFNMALLYLFGSQVESLLGVPRFVALYLLAALGGSAASLWFSSVLAFSLGASGAVFGIFGAYFVIARSKGLDTSQVVGLIVINLVLGAVIPQIDNAAHIGGLVTGAAVAAVYEWGGRQRGAAGVATQVAGVVAVAAVIVVATIMRVNQIETF
ncbi:MAG: rhomboid family intramembrane serine protease [Acidimicrobiales bacterium]